MIKQSIQVGTMELNSRIIMPPIATYQSTEDGKVTDTMLDYYGERAKSGNLGMVSTEHIYIMKQGKIASIVERQNLQGSDKSLEDIFFEITEGADAESEV